MPGLSRDNSSVSEKGSMKKQTSKVSLQKQDTLVLKKQSSSSRQSSVTKQVSKQVSKQKSQKSTTKKLPSVQKKLSSGVSQNGSLAKQASKAKRQLSQQGGGKRKRMKATKFEPETPSSPKKSPGKKKKKIIEAKPVKELLFNKDVFVAVRSDSADEPFYLAETLTAVWSNKDVVRIQWLSTQDQPEGIYVRNFPEKIETECLVCQVTLKGRKNKRYELLPRQKKRIEQVLKSCVDGVSEEDDDEEEDGKVSKKKTKKQALKKQGSKTQAKKRGSGTPKLKKKDSAKERQKAERAEKIAARKAEAAEKARVREEKKRLKELLATNPNALLKPRPKFKVLNVDPLLGSREKVPFISTSAHSRLVHRAVRLGDHKLLQQMIDDVKQIASVSLPYSVGYYRDPVQMALAQEDKKSLQILCKELFNRDHKKKARASFPASILSQVGTGTYNRRSLGVAKIRSIAMSRGSREGNNAFTKDPTANADLKSYIKHALRQGVSKKTLDAVMAAADQANNKAMCHDVIWLAVRWGNRKLAGELMKEQEAMGMTYFNALHRNALLLDGEEMKGPIRAISVRKKPWDNHKITPIHCAAINPNAKYLAKLLQVVPEYGIIDEKLCRPIHYAAACEGPGPLEFLLKRGQDPAETETSGMFPLLIACETGRLHNVKLLLAKGEQDKKEAEEKEDDDEDDLNSVAVTKYGVGGINRPCAKPQNMYCSYTPLHMAAEKGHTHIVKELAKHGADLEAPLNAGKDKKTAFMLACRWGHLDTVKELFALGAGADGQDKLNRSPLMHAVMSGHAHITSFLLSIGADPDRPDTSGNTCVHYAAAYGWYHCLKLLLEAGADPNAANDWKTTPLGIAFLKGNMGLADMLLEQPGVDINFKDEKGQTLTALACASPLEEGIVEQIDYLINQKKASVNILNVNNDSPLHHLAGNHIKTYNGSVNPDAVTRSIEIAKVLLKNGCDPGAKNDDGITPIMAAITEANTKLVEFLVSKGGVVSDAVNSTNQNVLHLMADQCTSTDMNPLLNIISKSIGKALLVKMVNDVDDQGMVPLLRACQAYKNWNGNVSMPSAPIEDDADSYDGSASDQESDMESGHSMSEKGIDDDDDNDDDDADNDEEDEPEEEEVVESDHEQDASAVPLAPNPLDVQRDKQWQNAREFINSLIKLGADINATVQRKKLPPDTVITKDEARHYIGKIGKFSALHMLIDVPRETKVIKKGAPIDYEPALTMLLKHKPETDCKDIYGRTPLISAVLANKVGPTNKLLDAGTNVHIASDNESEYKGSPFLLATKNQNELIMKALIKRGADVNVVEFKTGMMPIHYITKSTGAKTINFLEILLKAKANINAKDINMRTPLHLAVNANRGSTDVTSEIEQFIIDKGGDVHALDKHRRRPIQYVFVKIGRHTDTSSTDPIELCTTLTQTMKGRGLDEADDFGQTILHRAASRGASVCCMHLLQKGANINAVDKEKNTPLALAVRNRHESCTIMLIQKGANISRNLHHPPAPEKEKTKTGPREKPAWQWEPLRKDKKQETLIVPLFQEVISREWQGVIYMMLDLLEAFNVSYSQTVEAALKTSKYYLAMTLIRKARDKSILSDVNKQGQTLFHILADKSSFDNVLQIRVADMMSERGVSLSKADHYGCTPLHYSCLHRNSTLVDYILKKADNPGVNTKDKYGRTPAVALFWNPIPDYYTVRNIMQSLMKSGVKFDILYDHKSTNCESFGEKIVRERASYFEGYSERKISPLIMAVQSGSFDLVKGLLGSVNVNFCDAGGRSPIMHAVMMNDVNIVKLLLNHQYKIPVQKASTEPIIIPSSTVVRRGIPRKSALTPKKKAGLKRSHSRRLFTLGKSKIAAKKRKKKPVESSDDEDEDEDEDEGSEESEEEQESEEAHAADIESLSSGDIDLNYPNFQKKSKVDLTLRDKNGWTVLHYAVAPLKYGSYDNVQIIKLLVNAGAPLKQKDDAHQTPLDYAIENGVPKLTKALQKLMGIPQKQWKSPHIDVATVSEPVKFRFAEPHFKADADALLEKFEADCAAEEGRDVDYIVEPDDKLDMKNTGEVMKDEGQELYYDVLLTKIDVKAGYWGLYNFYKMQVVRQKGTDVFILFTRWGRIGDEGMYQRTPFPKLEEAVKEFCKVFRAKTGNPWKDVKNFDPKPKKYRLVDTERRKGIKKLKELKLDLQSDLPSQLPEYVQDMLKEMTNVKMMANTIRRTGVSEELMPFGRIKKGILLKAQGFLEQIKVLVDGVKKAEEKSPIEDLDKYYDDLNKIADLSSEYFHLIPRDGYAYERIVPLHEPNKVESEWKHLETLVELERASKVLAGAQYRIKEINPLDYVYRSLGCTIKLLEENTQVSQYILRYVRASFQGKVEAIYAVSREGESERLESCGVDNHMLLFHGSSTSNLISILSRGLLIAPAEAPTTGYMFGKGIYLADMFSKSAGYCYNWSHDSKTKFMLVCQAALGNVHDHYQARYMEKPTPTYQSTKGCGSREPDPQYDVILPDGNLIPLGVIRNTPTPEKFVKPNYRSRHYFGFNHNEYIVYNENQVRLRYIIQFSA